MTRLAFDTHRCTRDNCPLAARCMRKTPGHPTYQAYSEFPGGIDCHGFIEGRQE